MVVKVWFFCMKIKKIKILLVNLEKTGLYIVLSSCQSENSAVMWSIYSVNLFGDDLNNLTTRFKPSLLAFKYQSDKFNFSRNVVRFEHLRYKFFFAYKYHPYIKNPKIYIPSYITQKTTYLTKYSAISHFPNFPNRPHLLAIKVQYSSKLPA